MTNDSNNQKQSSAPLRATPRRIIRAIKVRADAKRKPWERFADYLTKAFGSFSFLAINAAWFATWVTVNLSVIPGIEPFDPYPFGLLTTTVSLEAIILSIIVLMSQNRAGKISDVREESALQVDIIAEQELTKVLELVVKIAERQGIDVSQDKSLPEMLKILNTEKIERVLEEQL